MSSLPITAGFEILRLLLRAVFELMRASNMTEEQLNQVYQQELALFLQNNPDELPDV